MNKKDWKRVKLDLSHDDLAPHFGRSLTDVAKEFGWSKTTLQKACRNIGIKSWPYKKLKKDPSNVPIQISEQASNLSGRAPPTPDMLILKAMHKGTVIRFGVCKPVNLEKVKEELSNRFGLANDTFKLMYRDYANELVSLISDQCIEIFLSDPRINDTMEVHLIS